MVALSTNYQHRRKVIAVDERRKRFSALTHRPTRGVVFTVPAPHYFLKTPRMGFRCWSPDDLSLAVELWGDMQVTRLIGGPFSRTQIQERLAREIACMQNHNVQYWPVFSLADDDFAGCCGLRPYKPEQRIHELGFHLRPVYWSKGLAVEAAREVISYAFESLNGLSLFAGHHPENLASRHVLEKLGFQYTHDELYAPTSKMHRCYLLELPG